MPESFPGTAYGATPPRRAAGWRTTGSLGIACALLLLAGILALQATTAWQDPWETAPREAGRASDAVAAMAVMVALGLAVRHRARRARAPEAAPRPEQDPQVLGELAAGIAHDINNTLQVIASQAAMAQRELGDADKVRARLAAVIDTAMAGALVTRRLLAFPRQGEMQRAALPVAAVLEEVRAMVAPALGPAIRVRVRADAGLPPVLADRDRLRAALLDLACNARDAMPQGGELELGAEPEAAGDRVRLWARDTGCGMDAATLARATEPFFTTKGGGPGAGLGLALLKMFAARSGGAMAIESAVGRGTTVSLWLPCTPQAALAAPADAGQPAAGARVREPA